MRPVANKTSPDHEHGEIVVDMPDFIAVYYFGPSPEQVNDFLFRKIEAQDIQEAERIVANELSNDTFRFAEESYTRCVVKSNSVLYVRVAPEERPDTEAIRASLEATKQAAGKEAARRKNYVRRLRLR